MENKTRSTFWPKFIVLLICGAVIFVIGWTQFKIDVGQVGVMVSKTGGVNSELIENGKFSWHWEFLLPTNVTLMKFTSGARSLQKTVSGSLPASQLFIDAIPKNSDAPWAAGDPFSYQISFDMSATVENSAIFDLVREKTISNDDDLQKYVEDALSNYADTLASSILKKAYKAEKDDGIVFAGDISIDNLLNADDFAQKYPYITLTKCTIKDPKLPSFTLYLAARKKYFAGDDFLDDLKKDNNKGEGAS